MDGADAAELAFDLAERKARAIAGRRHGALVIGADQVLAVGSSWFDKPATLVEARQQLERLRGSRLVLHTAIVLVQDHRLIWGHSAEPVLTMRNASDALLDLYVESEGPALLSCVGACRVEGPGQLLFDAIEGEQSAILGLPLLALLAELRRLSVVLG